MRDVAAERDERGITIRRVGVRDIHLPVMIREKAGGKARVLGVFDATVELPHHERGTHMSRLVEILNRWSRRAVAMPEMREILAEIRARRMPAARCAGFRLLLGNAASGERCPLTTPARSMRAAPPTIMTPARVEVLILTVCPCSRETRYGAHAQRAVIRARPRHRGEAIVWPGDLIPLLEAQGSERSTRCSSALTRSW